MRAAFSRQAGRVSIVQVVMVVIAAAIGYVAWKYGPVQMHKWAIADVARGTAARMMVEFDDRKLQEELRREVEERTGIQIGHLSELFLTREREGNVKRVEVHWTEQVDHVWGSTHTLEMVVVETAAPAEEALRMKNAH